MTESVSYDFIMYLGYKAISNVVMGSTGNEASLW